MKRRVVVPALLIAALAAGGLLYFTRMYPLEKVEAKPTVPAVPIVAGTVTQHDVPIYLSGVGTVIAYNTDIVRAQIQGQIISINFTEGQTVHAGDLLAQIDPRPYQAMIDQYTGNLERDQAQLENAQANLTRYTTLGNKGWATPQLLETQQAQVGRLQAAIKTDKALIDAAQGAAQLHAPDVADRWRGRHSSDRCRQHHQPVEHQRSRRRHAAPSDFADLHSAGDRFCRKSSSNSRKPRRRWRFSPTARTRRCQLDQGMLGLVNNEILQTTGSIQLKANFPTRRIGCGRASSSTRGCSSIPGMTA